MGQKTSHKEIRKIFKSDNKNITYENLWHEVVEGNLLF